MTYEQSMALRLASIFSSEASPAEGQALPAIERALSIQRLLCGGKWPDALATLDRGLSSSRMSPTSSPSEGAAIDAYAAGLIDGEGFIGLRGKQPRAFTAELQVGMAEKAVPLLREIEAEYGGVLRRDREATEKHSARWRWTVAGRQAEAVLARLRGHLRLKVAQADLILQAAQARDARIKRNATWPQDLSEEIAALSARIKELNAKGPQAVSALPAAGIWRRPQTSLLEPLGEGFSETWPRSGMCAHGTAYPLLPLAPRTSAIGSFALLPTPIKRDGSNRGTARGAGSVARGGQPSLHQALLPTPVSQDGKNATAPSQADRNSPPLTHVLLPTPTSHDRTHTPRPVAHGRQLANEIALLPTPTATPYGNNQSPSEGAAVRPSLESLATGGAATEEPSSDGKKSPAPLLNPCFVEWMLGLPEGWSDPDCPLSATEFSSRLGSASATASSTTSKGQPHE